MILSVICFVLLEGGVRLLITIDGVSVQDEHANVQALTSPLFTCIIFPWLRLEVDTLAESC